MPDENATAVREDYKIPGIGVVYYSPLAGGGYRVLLYGQKFPDAVSARAYLDRVAGATAIHADQGRV